MCSKIPAQNPVPISSAITKAATESTVNHAIAIDYETNCFLLSLRKRFYVAELKGNCLPWELRMRIYSQIVPRLQPKCDLYTEIFTCSSFKSKHNRTIFDITYVGT